jgi:acetyltransferase-like isoleucine patch superfamily enzyme
MIIKSYLKDCREHFRLYKHQQEWIKRRGNNFTRAANIFPISRVNVGDYTYGKLNIHCYNQPEEHLTIGAYCSIADNVHIFLGGGMTFHILRHTRLKTG